MKDLGSVCRKFKLQPSSSKPIDVVNSGVEHNYHKTGLKDSIRQKKKVLGDWSAGEMPLSAGNNKLNEVTIVDLDPDDARTALVMTRGDLETSSVSGLPSNATIPTSTAKKNSVKRPAISILKPLVGGPKKPAVARKSSGIGSLELTELPAGFLDPVLDQNVGQILILDEQNHGIWEEIVNDNGGPNSQIQSDIVNLVNPSSDNEAQGLDGNEQPLDAPEVGSQAYTCEHCEEVNAKSFATEFELSWHKIKCHWDQCHECSYCGRRFSSANSLKHHIKRHLGIRPRQRRKNHRCDECGLHFDTLVRLKGHRFRHTGEKPYECSECGKRFTMRSNMERHQMLHTGYRPFLCDFCGKGFVQKNSLIDHVNLHHEDANEIECALCSCKLKNRGDMEKHALEVHQLSQLVELNTMIKKPETYLCDLCGKNFVSVGSLRQHIKGHGNKPARCETCGKKFSTFYGLQLHLKLHTGERPFVCEVCQKGFIQKTSLITHLATHSGNKPFLCVVCSKSFSSKGQLKQHMMMHSGEKPYKCGICNKQFTYKSSLTLHNRIHTGDKPYTCTVCGTSYTQMHHLRGHMRTHTGEKPFVCEICSKSYKNKIDLRYHYTRFHKIDVKRITLNSRSEYIFDIDRKVEVPDTPVENTGDGIMDEFTVCEFKAELDS